MKLKALAMIAMASLVPSCAPKEADPLSAPGIGAEISEYRPYVRSHEPGQILKKLKARAEEPYVLAGEDVESLTLETLCLLRELGDARFTGELEKLEPREVSTLRLFLSPGLLGVNSKHPDSAHYPKTVRKIRSSAPDDSWPALKIEAVAKKDDRFVDPW